MTDLEIIEGVRRQFVDGYREWDANYDAFMAALEKRLDCLQAKMAKLGHDRQVTRRGPTGDVHYYSIELAWSGPTDRSAATRRRIEQNGGVLTYLVAYCSSALPLVEMRWFAFTSENDWLRSRDYDLLDETWLSEHPELTDSALEKPPAGWPPPLASYDYQNGDYILRDYIIRGMRDY